MKGPILVLDPDECARWEDALEENGITPPDYPIAALVVILAEEGTWSRIFTWPQLPDLAYCA